MTLPMIVGEFRVAGDVDFKFSPSGMAYARFRAVADKKKKVDEQWVDDKVFWTNITVFGKTAENLAESVAKGDLVYIEGNIETREYTTDSGEKRTSVDIAANKAAVSLSRSPATGASTASAGNAASSAPAQENPWGGGAPSSEPPF